MSDEPPIKKGIGLRSRSDGHLWTVSRVERDGTVHYLRYANGWCTGICHRRDVDLHFERITPLPQSLT